MRILQRFSLVVIALFAFSAFAGAGAKLYNEFVDTNSIYKEERWQNYISDLGHHLLRYTKTDHRKFYFFVLDSPEINAFATPDGYIFVNSGLLAFLESEDQLAAVVGHEIGHVIAKHGARQRLTELLGKSAGIAAHILTGRGEMQQVGDATTRALIAGYGREMELEADKIGAEIVARAGYNPNAIIDTLHVLKDQALFSRNVRGQPSNYHGLFATHPQNDKRLHEVVAYAISLMPDELARPRADFWKLIEGLKFGAEAKVGLLADNVFFDRTNRVVFEYPKDWRVRYSQQQVVGEAHGGSPVAWVSITKHTPMEVLEPSEFVTEILQREDVEEETTLELKGQEIYLATLSTEGSQNKRALLALIYRGQDVFVIRGEAGPQGNDVKFRTDFEQILGGIRDLKPSDLNKDTRASIVIVEAKPGDTYAGLSTGSPVASNPVEMHRLINGDYPQGEPRAGDLIKVIR